MAKKDLIIGAFKNYNFEQIKPWIKSINESGFEGDKVLIAINATNETINKIEEHGFKAIKVQPMTDAMFHMERFFHIYNYLKTRKNEYRFVITTDVRDVVFQKNPSVYLVSTLGEPTSSFGRDLLAVSETLLIKNEHWNRNNIITSFGQYFYQDVEDKEVLNVGTLAGRTSQICDLCGVLYQLSLNRADWVADQAAYNILMNWEPYKSITKFVDLSEPWCCNLHVTNKPVEKDHFAPFILQKPPIFDGTQVLNGTTQQPFYIVHQYDRDPELLKYFNDKYEVEELITFRTN